MRLAGEGVDNLLKGGTLVRLKTVIGIAYMGIDPNDKVCIVGVKHKIVFLAMNLC